MYLFLILVKRLRLSKKENKDINYINVENKNEIEIFKQISLELSIREDDSAISVIDSVDKSDSNSLKINKKKEIDETSEDPKDTIKYLKKEIESLIYCGIDVSVSSSSKNILNKLKVIHKKLFACKDKYFFEV